MKSKRTIKHELKRLLTPIIVGLISLLGMRFVVASNINLYIMFDGYLKWSIALFITHLAWITMFGWMHMREYAKKEGIVFLAYCIFRIGFYACSILFFGLKLG